MKGKVLHVGSHKVSSDNYDTIRWFTPWWKELCAIVEAHVDEKVAKEYFDKGYSPEYAAQQELKRR